MVIRRVGFFYRQILPDFSGSPHFPLITEAQIMDTAARTVGLSSEKTPYGKVIGVVTDRREFQAISEAFSKLGLDQIETWEGARGVEEIEGWKETVAHTFLGDVESEIVTRYLMAVNRGWIVFAVSVDPALARQVAEAAKAQGASEIVDFGTLVITNY